MYNVSLSCRIVETAAFAHFAVVSDVVFFYIRAIREE